MQPLHKLILDGQINESSVSNSKMDVMNVAVSDVIKVLKELHVSHAALKANINAEVADPQIKTFLPSYLVPKRCS